MSAPGPQRQYGQRGRGSRGAKRFVPKNSDPTSSSSSSSRRADAVFVPKSTPTTLTSSLRGPALPSNGDGRTGAEFVYYLPQDEAVASGFGVEDGGLDAVESQAVVDFLNSELSLLLKMNSKQFWEGVARSSSLGGFLDSYLRFRNRWYDLPHRGPKGTIAGVLIGETDFSRRVFIILYRMSSNKDPSANSGDCLNSKEHAALLQEKKWLDLPKLMDICAIYGLDNASLTRMLVTNAVKSQPNIIHDISSALSHFLNIIYTMHQRCASSLEILVTSPGSEALLDDQLQKDLLEVLDFINDAVVTMDSFIDAYRPAAIYLSCPTELSDGNEELLNVLARIHDTLLPLFQFGFMRVSPSVKILYSRIAKFGWNLLETCYLNNNDLRESFSVQPIPKIFPAMVDDPVIRGDICVQALAKVNAEVSFYVHDLKNHVTFLQSIERRFNLLAQISSLRHKGWIFLDDQQFTYISDMVTSSILMSTGVEKSKSLIASESNNFQADEDTAIMESKISQVRDLFPDYGTEFIAACLEAYDHNPEEVIQRILDGNLHQDLLALDKSIEKVNAPESTPRVTSSKGKDVLPLSIPQSSSSSGKMGQPSSSTSSVIGQPFLLSEEMGRPSSSSSSVIAQPSSSSSSSMMGQPSSSSSVVSQTLFSGKFIRKNDYEYPDSEILDSRTAKDSVRTAILESQYDDEYDDSFDELGLSVVESGTEMLDISGNRIGTSPDKASPSEGSSKWPTRSQPQYYVKDGKNYSYKVAGSVPVVNADEAALVNQAQREIIHGLGRGGNFPLGAVRKLTESEEVEDESEVVEDSGSGRGNRGGRGGRRGGGGRQAA